MRAYVHQASALFNPNIEPRMRHTIQIPGTAAAAENKKNTGQPTDSDSTPETGLT
jgi:hypothetical protein